VKEKRSTVGHKEEPINKNHKYSDTGVSRVEVERFFSLFRGINPSYGKMFANRTQAESVKRLIKMNSFDFWAGFLAKHNVSMRTDKFYPRAITPWQLEERLGDIEAYLSAKKVGQLTGNGRGRGMVV
jgi:hypothetical protein